MTTLDSRQFRQRTEDLFHTVVKFTEDEGITFDNLLAHLCRRFYMPPGPNQDLVKAELYSQIIHGENPLAKRTLTDEEGNYIQQSLELGEKKYTTLRLALNPKVKLPTTDSLRDFRNDAMPKLVTVRQNGKWANLQQIVEIATHQTLKHLVKSTLWKNEHFLDVQLRIGFDGSRRHSQFRSFQTGSNNLILGGKKLFALYQRQEPLVYQ